MCYSATEYQLIVKKLPISKVTSSLKRSALGAATKGLFIKLIKVSRGLLCN